MRAACELAARVLQYAGTLVKVMLHFTKKLHLLLANTMTFRHIVCYQHVLSFLRYSTMDCSYPLIANYEISVFPSALRDDR